jgi:hypothetical protein
MHSWNEKQATVFYCWCGLLLPSCYIITCLWYIIEKLIPIKPCYLLMLIIIMVPFHLNKKHNAMLQIYGIFFAFISQPHWFLLHLWCNLRPGAVEWPVESPVLLHSHRHISMAWLLSGVSPGANRLPSIVLVTVKRESNNASNKYKPSCTW